MQMELVLLKNVRNLGKMGDIARVAMGYGRYLLRQNVALRSTKENRDHFEAQRSHWEQLDLAHKEEAETLATLLNKKVFSLVRQAGESGHLYGSVSAKDIFDLLKAVGFPVPRNAVSLPHPLKTLGHHSVTLDLHADVFSDICIVIAKTAEEAALQKAVLEKASKPQDVPSEDSLA